MAKSRVSGCPLTATRARAAFLKSKRKGDTWEENGRLYRMGPRGVTVFHSECLELAAWGG